MNKTFIIIQREFMNRASKKSFILLTILMPFIFAATVLLPVMLAMVKSDEAKEVVVVDQTGKYLSQFQDNESYHFVPGSEMKEEYRTDTSGVSAVVMITDDLIKDPSAAVIYSRKEIPNSLSRIVNEALNTQIRHDKLIHYNIPQLQDIMKDFDQTYSIRTVKWSEDGSVQESNSGLATASGMVLTILIYIFVLSYGGMVMQSVMEEKTNRIAMEMLEQGMIDEKTAIMRCEPNKLDELLHPVFDKEALRSAKVLTRGLPASPGAACGQIVFFADDAAQWRADGHRVVLVRIETSPEDLAGMTAAEGILTARGGMTSHAAVVARGMGKCCVSGAGAINVDYKARTVEIDGTVLKEGDFISLNGSTGEVYAGEVPTRAAELSGDFAKLMKLCDKYTRLKVRTNADTPHDAEVARSFGATGIGLCRTEHMFFDNQKIIAMREMILAPDVEGRKKALDKLLPYQKADFKGIFKAMDGCPVNVRLLDPPLHEFVPHDLKGQEEMAKAMGVTVDYIRQRVESLCEHNPMLGHRGCRLGNTYPEITEMQTRAILGAACELKKEGYDPHPEIMVPLIGILYEFEAQEKVIRETAAQLFKEEGVEIPFKVGTMIEVPRAALTADRIASHAEYFSFGTNDLTQMTFGYSRDDIASFLPVYLEKKILKVDPFQVLDQNGVGQLVEMAVQKGRSVRPDLKCGICGEHGGEPSSVKFCHKVGLDYVSCSPFRVPIARLAAAQAAIEE